MGIPAQRKRDAGQAAKIRKAIRLVDQWPGIRREHRDAYQALVSAGAAFETFVVEGSKVVAAATLASRWGISASAVERRLSRLCESSLLARKVLDHETRLRLVLPAELPAKPAKRKPLKPIGDRDPQRSFDFGGAPKLGLFKGETRPAGGPEVKTVTPETVFTSTRPTPIPAHARLPGPGPGPSPGPGPNEIEEGEEGAGETPLESAILDGIPELQECGDRMVSPLPPGALAYGGVFQVLVPTHLRNRPAIVEWFRRQLGAARPVTEPTERDLLLTLATAAWVTSPSSKSTTPVGRFAYIVQKAEWWRVASMIPEGRKSLTRAVAAHPGLLQGGDWPLESQFANLAPEAAAPQEPALSSDDRFELHRRAREATQNTRGGRPR